MSIAYWGRFFVFGLTLLLAGCFQQAGESLQPANDTIAPPVINTQSAQDAPTSEASSTPDTPGDGDATDLPITVFAPPTATPVAPTSTPVTPAADTESGADDGSTATPGFITPGVQLGPEMDTPTPVEVLETTATPSGLVTPTALSNDNAASGGACTYTVQAGDNLYRIAINNETTVADMRAANPGLAGENPVLQPGQVLQLPNCTPDTAAAPPTDAPAAPVTQPPVPQPTAVGDPPVATGQQTYTVQRGDTLYAIAIRFGTTINAIVEANELANPDRLELGQELIIPVAP